MTDYIYRQLTPEERAEIVCQRRAKGNPIHAPPHPFRQAGYYAITAANFDHSPIMALAQRCTDFEAMLLEVLSGIDANVVGWVILPNHYHLLVGLQLLDDFSTAIQRLHGRTSHDWNLEDGLTCKRRVWYKFYDRQIRNQRHYYKALNYIHYNPVKHNYVHDPYEWPWTSLHNYFEDKGREWLRLQWHEFPPDNEMSEEFQE